MIRRGGVVDAGVRAGVRGTVAGGEPVEEWDGTVLIVAARAFVPTDAGTLPAVAVCCCVSCAARAGWIALAASAEALAWLPCSVSALPATSTELPGSSASEEPRPISITARSTH